MSEPEIPICTTGIPLPGPGASCEGSWTREQEAVPLWVIGAIKPPRLRSSAISAMETANVN